MNRVSSVRRKWVVDFFRGHICLGLASYELGWTCWGHFGLDFYASLYTLLKKN